MPWSLDVPFAMEIVILAMKILITVAVLAAALHVILARRYAARDKLWAYGAVGLITAYWLKP
jgi:hypothetical protein